MEFHHKDALTEKKYHRYVYSTVCIATIDKIKSTVNLVSSIDLSFLKTGGGPQPKRMHSTFMTFLKTERLYFNQVGATVDYAYEQVLAFTNSCYTNDFVQV